MSTNTSDIMVKMIQFSNGNRHDINHFMKVYTYAKTIAESENVSEKDLITVETAAIVHDIACPLCREKYGNTNGKYQEKEGILLAEEFLKDTDLPEEIKKRVVFLVGHHPRYFPVCRLCGNRKIRRPGSVESCIFRGKTGHDHQRRHDHCLQDGRCKCFHSDYPAGMLSANVRSPRKSKKRSMPDLCIPGCHG